MSSLLLCKDFMLRWICLLCFFAHTSCYVGYVFSASLHPHTSCYIGYILSTSLHTLHVTLDTSSLLRCTHFMLRWICLVYFVLAHTGTIDNCWKACKKMLPSSLSSQSPMIMAYAKAWQWRYVHRNGNVCNFTAKTVSKLG